LMVILSTEIDWLKPSDIELTGILILDFRMEMLNIQNKWY